MVIAKIMIPKVCTVVLHSDDTIRQGLEIMRRHSYTALPVLDEEDRYIGSVTEGDFLRHIMATETTDVKEHEKYSILHIVRRDFCLPLDIEANEESVVAAALRQNFVPIVDDRGCLCGIVTRCAVIESLAEEIKEFNQQQ